MIVLQVCDDHADDGDVDQAQSQSRVGDREGMIFVTY